MACEGPGSLLLGFVSSRLHNSVSTRRVRSKDANTQKDNYESDAYLHVPVEHVVDLFGI